MLTVRNSEYRHLTAGICAAQIRALFELRVNPDCTTVSGNDARFCQGVGRYDPSRSSTSKSLGTTPEDLRYGIGSANITYFTDTIQLPGTTDGLTGVQFGVATSTQAEFSGILGIGYGDGPATRYRISSTSWRRRIRPRSRAFTLALGRKDEQRVSTCRRRRHRPVLRHACQAAHHPGRAVPRQGAAVLGQHEQSIALPPSGKVKPYPGGNLPVFLDSGSTMTLLPAPLASAIAADFGSTQPDSDGFYEVDCSLARVNGTLDSCLPGDHHPCAVRRADPNRERQSPIMLPGHLAELLFHTARGHLHAIGLHGVRPRGKQRLDDSSRQLWLYARAPSATSTCSRRCGEPAG